jgi:hypothetical protein
LIDFLDGAVLFNWEKRATSGPKVRIDNMMVAMIMIAKFLESYFCKDNHLLMLCAPAAV